MSAGHTPGPWIAGDDEDSDYYLVGPHDGDGIVSRAVVKLHDEANALLIAAAPELLDELVNCLDLMVLSFPSAPVDSCIGVATIKARAAIAKATGATP